MIKDIHVYKQLWWHETWPNWIYTCSCTEIILLALLRTCKWNTLFHPQISKSLDMLTNMMSDMKTAKYLWVKSGQVTTNLAIILKPSAGGSLRIGDWRILRLSCHILWLMFGSLHVYDNFFIQRVSLFQKGWSSWYIFSSTNIRSWRLSTVVSQPEIPLLSVP